jgi:hypothetical protein
VRNSDYSLSCERSTESSNYLAKNKVTEMLLFEHIRGENLSAIPT